MSAPARGRRKPRAGVAPALARHVGADGLPWIPFLVEGVHIKLLKVSPATGEMVFIVRAEPGTTLGECYRHGAVVIYTISGRWRYRGADWTAGAGDAVLAPAGSTQAFETVGDAPAQAFVRIIGALEFRDEAGKTVCIENAETLHGRYLAHCALHGIAPVDLAG